MKQKRRQYTQEFKEEAVKLITDQGYLISEASRNLGMNENMLGRWKQELTQGKWVVFGSEKQKRNEVAAVQNERMIFLAGQGRL